jgi:hypothetical protein
MNGQSSWKAHLINRAVKKLDSRLFAIKDTFGVIQVLRKNHLDDSTDFILALTENWQANGKPIDAGTDYVMHRLRYCDGWNNNDYDEFCKKRDMMEVDRKRQTRNEFRAVAADMRKDFAKATSDFNLSSL